MSDCANGQCGVSRMKHVINARAIVVDEVFRRLKKALDRTSTETSATRNDVALIIGVVVPDGQFIHMRDVDWKSKRERNAFSKWLRTRGIEIDAEDLVKGLQIP